MKKFAIPMVIASLMLATLACNALAPATTPVPVFAPKNTATLVATETPSSTATPEPTRVPLELELKNCAVYSNWEDADGPYETPPGYVWAAVEHDVVSGDPYATVDGWLKEGKLPVITNGEGTVVSEQTIVYILEDGKVFAVVTTVPEDTPIKGMTMLYPDGSTVSLEGCFSGGETGPSGSNS